jgi:hypothetical protein
MENEFRKFLSPHFFFSYEVDLHPFEGKFEKRHLLPPLSLLVEEKPFAKVSMGWSHDALFFRIQCSMTEGKVNPSRLEESDTIELFIDTKRLEDVRTTHRFCHHFCLFSEPIEGVQVKEITRFRTEDSHPLAAGVDLEAKVVKMKGGYEAFLRIGKGALVGYEPEEGRFLGFTYRIRRSKGAPQHFGLSSSDISIEYYPYLWTALKLCSS